MMRVGWVGLGAMGSPMARCVARAGHGPVAYDIDPGRAASLADDGVRPAASIRFDSYEQLASFHA